MTTHSRNIYGKYREVGRTALKAQTAYRFDVLVGSTMPVVRLFLAFSLWRVLFTGKTEIGGFTLQTMIAYYLLTSFFARLDQSNGMVWEMADDIREGRFARYMTKPISPLGNFLTVALSRSWYVLGMNSLLLLSLWLILFSQIQVHQPLVVWAGIALLIILGLFFQALLNYCIGVLAFRFNDIVGFLLVKQNAIDFLAGSLIPLSLLPEPVISGMRFLPFYALHYLPASILVGRSAADLPFAILVLSFWTAIALLVAIYSYRRLSRQFEGVGS